MCFNMYTQMNLDDLMCQYFKQDSYVHYACKIVSCILHLFCYICYCILYVSPFNTFSYTMLLVVNKSDFK